MAQRILVVDDEPQIHRFLRPALVAAGYDVLSAAKGAEAIKSVATLAPDAVVLDLGLPDMDGMDVIAEVRRWSQVPIVVLSARDREAEKIGALDLGANDYVNKPFGIGELMARLRAALRHHGQNRATPAKFRPDPVAVDVAAHAVTCRGEAVHLTREGIRLARHTGAQRRPRHHPPPALEFRLGPGAHRGSAISSRLHRAVAPEDRTRSNRPLLIATEAGIGYRFNAEE